MVNFGNHVYSKQIILKDVDGVEEQYTFKAIGAQHLPKLFKTISKLSGIKEGSEVEEILEALDEQTVETLRELVSVMVKKSYESIEEDALDEFVSAHFMELFPVLFEVCLPKQ